MRGQVKVQGATTEVVIASGRFKGRVRIVPVEDLTWYWSIVDVAVKVPDHDCSPECKCWEKEIRR